MNIDGAEQVETSSIGSDAPDGPSSLHFEGFVSRICNFRVSNETHETTWDLSEPFVSRSQIFLPSTPPGTPIALLDNTLVEQSYIPAPTYSKTPIALSVFNDLPLLVPLDPYPAVVLTLPPSGTLESVSLLVDTEKSAVTDVPFILPLFHQLVYTASVDAASLAVGDAPISELSFNTSHALVKIYHDPVVEPPVLSAVNTMTMIEDSVGMIEIDAREGSSIVFVTLPSHGVLYSPPDFGKKVGHEYTAPHVVQVYASSAEASSGDPSRFPGPDTCTKYPDPLCGWTPTTLTSTQMLDAKIPEALYVTSITISESQNAGSVLSVIAHHPSGGTTKLYSATEMWGLPTSSLEVIREQLDLYQSSFATPRLFSPPTCNTQEPVVSFTIYVSPPATLSSLVVRGAKDAHFPSVGTVGKYMYIPDKDYHGTDSVEFLATDCLSASSRSSPVHTTNIIVSNTPDDIKLLGPAEMRIKLPGQVQDRLPLGSLVSNPDGLDLQIRFPGKVGGVGDLVVFREVYDRKVKIMSYVSYSLENLVLLVSCSENSKMASTSLSIQAEVFSLSEPTKTLKRFVIEIYFEGSKGADETNFSIYIAGGVLATVAVMVCLYCLKKRTEKVDMLNVRSLEKYKLYIRTATQMTDSTSNIVAFIVAIVPRCQQIVPLYALFLGSSVLISIADAALCFVQVAVLQQRVDDVLRLDPFYDSFFEELNKWEAKQACKTADEKSPKVLNPRSVRSISSRFGSKENSGETNDEEVGDARNSDDTLPSISAENNGNLSESGAADSPFQVVRVGMEKLTFRGKRKRTSNTTERKTVRKKKEISGIPFWVQDAKVRSTVLLDLRRLQRWRIRVLLTFCSLIVQDFCLTCMNLSFLAHGCADNFEVDSDADLIEASNSTELCDSVDTGIDITELDIQLLVASTLMTCIGIGMKSVDVVNFFALSKRVAMSENHFDQLTEGLIKSFQKEVDENKMAQEIERLKSELKCRGARRGSLDKGSSKIGSSISRRIKLGGNEGGALATLKGIRDNTFLRDLKKSKKKSKKKVKSESIMPSMPGE